MLTAGTRIGSYEITGPLGAGGMGEVYRARDRRLNRSVAIKVLPASVTHDPDRLMRFRREAQVLAGINHPNIAHLYGLEDGDGIQALVMELVEGPTLADRIAAGALSVEDALPIARQVAEALEAAHEQGIIHRDLKPANIAVREDGTAKVLDFGLARPVAPESSDSSHSPTITSPALTAAGVILGTAAYMSPEQARGKLVDKRADVWAFGCVLFEMLTGRRTFGADSVAETIASIFSRAPEWAALPATTPPHVRHLLERCLEKDPNRRLRDIGEARIQLDPAYAPSPTVPNPLVSSALPGRRLSTSIAGALALLAIGAAAPLWWSMRAVPAPEVRLHIPTPPTIDLVSFAFAHDGRRIAYVAEWEGRPRLWVRSLDSVSARTLPDTDFATYPFWSPDNQSIGFFANGRLKRIDLAGGSPRVLARVSNPRGAAWMDDGTIVFGENGPLSRVAADGGEPQLATQVGPHQQSHRFPQRLPDGRRFLYYALGNTEGRGVFVGSIDGSEPRRLFDAETVAVYASSGHLLFVRQGTLVAQAFDAETLTVGGEPFPVAEQVSRDPLSIQSAAVAASAAGPIAYRAGSVGVARSLAWFNRSGAIVEPVGEPGSAGQNPSLSPDDLHVAVDRAVAGNVDLWLTDVRRGLTERLTSNTSIDAYPTWSSDGRTIAFGSLRSGLMNLFSRPVSGTGREELLLETPEAKAPTDWSRDGRYLLYRSSGAKTGYDLWALPFDSDRKPGVPFVVAQSAFDERDGVFSPDGHWVAYESNESDRPEVYLQRFPNAEGKIRVSPAGGAQVRWSRDGREVFYLGLDGKLMAAPVRPVTRASAPADPSLGPLGGIEIGVPVALFATQLGGAQQGASRQRYMVSSDGRRFLMNTVVGTAPEPITVILNWRAERAIDKE